MGISNKFRAIVFLFVFLTACQSQPPFVLKTDPPGAQVWVGEKLVGQTPLRLANARQENVQLELDGYVTAFFEEMPLISQEEINIRLFPEYDDPGLIFEDLAYGAISDDWKWAEGGNESTFDLEVENLLNQDGSLRIWSGISDVELPYNLVFSSDGDHIAYLTAYGFGPKCGFFPEKVWLTTLSNLNERKDLLGVKEYDIPGCWDKGLVFSPDGNWLAVKLATGVDVYNDNYVWLYSVSDDTLAPYELGQIERQAVVLWSKDSNWIAYRNDAGKNLVYQWNNSNWEFVSGTVAGDLVTWSPNGGVLWTIIENDSGDASLRLTDVETGETIEEHELGAVYSYFKQAVWSEDGNRLAVTFAGDEIKNEKGYSVYPGYVMFWVRDGETKTVPTNQNVYFLYWLDGINQVAVLVSLIEADPYQFRMELIGGP